MRDKKDLLQKLLKQEVFPTIQPGLTVRQILEDAGENEEWLKQKLNDTISDNNPMTDDEIIESIMIGLRSGVVQRALNHNKQDEIGRSIEIDEERIKRLAKRISIETKAKTRVSILDLIRSANAESDFLETMIRKSMEYFPRLRVVDDDQFMRQFMKGYTDALDKRVPDPRYIKNKA